MAEEPPRTAANVIHTRIRRLRHALEPAREQRSPGRVVARVGDGYALQVPPDGLDYVAFRTDLAQAVRQLRDGDPATAATAWARGLARWQADPAIHLPALASHPAVIQLRNERRAAHLHYADLMTRLGSAADVVPGLARLVREDPLDEAARERLIRAPHASGRRAEALATFFDARRVLADELGLDPSPALAAAHAAVLSTDTPPLDEGPRRTV